MFNICFPHKWEFKLSGLLVNPEDHVTKIGLWISDRCKKCGKGRTRFFRLGEEIPYPIDPVTGEFLE